MTPVTRLTTSRLTTIDYRLTTLAIGLLLCAGPTVVNAQVIQRPERPIAGLFGGGRPPDPDRARHDLLLTVNTMGGYDNSPNPAENSGGLQTFAPREPGYTGFAETTVEYRRGRRNHSFELGGRGFVNAHRNVGLTPGFGGDLRANLSAPLGRRHQLDLSADGRSAPFYQISAFAPLSGVVNAGVLPNANPVNGFLIRRSLSGDGTLSLSSRWTPRDTVSANYGYRATDFPDNIGDGHSHAASVAYRRSIGRSSGFRVTYRASDSRFLEQGGLVRPNRTQAAELGYDLDRQLSRTRRLTLGFGTGATYVETVNGLARNRLHYVMPSGHVNLRVDVVRTWSMSADYRRATSLIEGLTAETFITDTGLLRVGGFVGSRLELAFSAAHSNGAAIVPGSTAKFDSYSGTIQLRFMLTRWWSATVNQNVYAYQLHGFNLPPGLLPRLERNATRVGMTWNLPLYGAYIGRRTRPGQ